MAKTLAILPLMKKIKRYILSGLLLTFAFFTVHDYIIVAFDADTQYELCYAQIDSTVVDLSSQIHQDIHTLMSMLESTTLSLNVFSTTLCFFEQYIQPYSTINPVPQRPPLI